MLKNWAFGGADDALTPYPYESAGNESNNCLCKEKNYNDMHLCDRCAKIVVWVLAEPYHCKPKELVLKKA